MALVASPVEPDRFQTKYQEAKERRAQQRLEKQRRSETDESFSRIRQTNPAVRDRIIGRKKTVGLRLRTGFRHIGGTVAGQHYPPFSEAGLRSESEPLLRRVVAGVSRTSKLRIGREKTAVSGVDSKLLALDEPYIELNACFRVLIRVDLDGDFASLQNLLQALTEIGVPTLPNVVVSTPDRSGQGRCIRPHLLFLLPHDQAVWTDKSDPRCRQGPIRLLKRVQTGLTKLLLPLGADPNGLLNARKIKNPCSPFWSCEITNEHRFMSLADWAASPSIDLRASRDALLRKAAEIQTKLDPVSSNELFSAVQKIAWDVLRTWHEAGEPNYIVNLEDRDALGNRLIEEIIRRIEPISSTDPQTLEYMGEKVGRYAAAVWDSRHGIGRLCPNRGAMRGSFSPEASTKARQAAAGRRSADLKAETALKALKEAYVVAAVSGRSVNKAAIARAAGVSRNTAHKRWTEMLPKAGGPDAR